MIEIRELSKSFDNNKTFAVNNISFTVDSGNIASLIGTSGCGKTTTLKMINRIVEPSKGYILINGKGAMDIDGVSWRREIGYVVQKAGLFPHLTIKQNITLLPDVLNINKEQVLKRVKELFELISLDYNKFKDRYPAELSGGQQQRIGIARALVQDPKVLLMDEPFGALDPITRNSIHEELLSINQELGKTILMVTHDIHEAFKLSDKIIVMDQGKIIQTGTPKEIEQNPKSLFIKEFVK